MRVRKDSVCVCAWTVARLNKCTLSIINQMLTAPFSVALFDSPDTQYPNFYIKCFIVG